MPNNEIKVKSKTVEYCISQISGMATDVSNLQKECVNALKFFNANPSIVKSSKKKSQATTNDFRDAVEWMRPALLDIFTSNSEVAKLEPSSEEDVVEVKKVDKLINYQLKVKNKWYQVIRDFIDDALMFRVAVIKYQWYNDIKKFKKSYRGLNELEAQAIKKKENTTVTEEIHTQIGVDPNTGVPIYSYDITLLYEETDSYPLIESVPLNEIGFKSNIKSVEDAFIYHIIPYSKFEFIKKYGKQAFKKVEEIKDPPAESSDELRTKMFEDIGGEGFIYDKDDDKYNVYECQYKNQDTGEATITELCGDVELRTFENKYGKPTFIISSILRRAHRLVGSSQFELNKDYQRTRTALLRQIMDNVFYCNNRRTLVDPLKVNMDDFLNNNDFNAVIKIQGGDINSCTRQEEKTPLQPEVFGFWETLLTEKDYHTGIPRSYQGINPRQLNKTFRGQNQQIEQASQRVAEAARNMAETVIAPLIDAVIDMNIKFLDKKIAFRYLNENITIEPDNIVGRYDVFVNVGIGTGDKEKIVTQMEQLLSLFAQTVKAGVPVVNAQDVFNVFKELIQAMGYKNVNDYITDPKVNMIVAELVKMIIASGIIKQIPEAQQIVQQAMAAFGMNLNPNSLGSDGVNPPQAAQPQNPILPGEGALQQ